MSIYIRLLPFALAIIMLISGIGGLVHLYGKNARNTGFAEAMELCSEQKDKLVNREAQDEIHKILGKYTGTYDDNNTYDYNAINRLFSK